MFKLRGGMIFIEGGIICCVFFKLRGGGSFFLLRGDFKIKEEIVLR